MSTVSVPLSAELEREVKALVASGYGSNKADVIRRALKRAAEEAAVERVLRAIGEPSLKGNLRTLVKKI